MHTESLPGRLSTVQSNASGTLANTAPNLTHTYAYHPNSNAPHTITSNDSVNQYDDIGNRIAMKYGGDKNGANLRTVAYDTNGKNQYSMVEHPGYFHITGMAGLTSASPGQAPGVGTIEINNTQLTSSEFQGAFFFKELLAANTSNSVLVPITLDETRNDGSTPTPPNLGDVFVPKKNIVPVFQNGNLINDGRWIYSWDASNRLQRMVPVSGVSANLPILDFLYDWKGRRISKMATYALIISDPGKVSPLR